MDRDSLGGCASTVRHPPVGVAIVVLSNQDPAARLVPSEGHDEVQRSRQAPPVSHLGVAFHLDSPVDGPWRRRGRFRREGEVLSQPELYLGVSLVVHRHLGGHSQWLYRCPQDPGDRPHGDWNRESVRYVLGQEEEDLGALCCRGLMVSAGEDGCQFFCPFRFGEFHFVVIGHPVP